MHPSLRHLHHVDDLGLSGVSFIKGLDRWVAPLGTSRRRRKNTTTELECRVWCWWVSRLGFPCVSPLGSCRGEAAAWVWHTGMDCWVQHLDWLALRPGSGFPCVSRRHMPHGNTRTRKRRPLKPHTLCRALSWRSRGGAVMLRDCISSTEPSTDGAPLARKTRDFNMAVVNNNAGLQKVRWWNVLVC